MLKVKIILFLMCATVAVSANAWLETKAQLSSVFAAGYDEGYEEGNGGIDSAIAVADALKEQKRIIAAEDAVNPPAKPAPAILHKKAKPSKPASLWAAYDGMQ